MEPAGNGQDRDDRYNFNGRFGDPRSFTEIRDVFFFRTPVNPSELPADRFNEGQRNYIANMMAFAAYLNAPPPPVRLHNQNEFPLLKNHGKVSKKEKRGEFNR